MRDEIYTREGSWQRRQREARESLSREVERRRNIARDPATRKTQRDAFLQGAKHIREVYFLPQNAEQAGADYHEAERRFPKVLTRTVPRVVTELSGISWRIVPSTDPALDHRLEYREKGDDRWQDELRAGSPGPTPARIRLWHSLLQQMTEEVAV